MSLNEIRESGLLELYVLGDLGEIDTRLVEEALLKFPSLKQDLNEIEQAYEIYANAHAVPAPSSVLNNVLSEANGNKQRFSQEPTKVPIEKPSLWTKLLPWFSLIGLLGLSIMLYIKSNTIEENNSKHKIELQDCINSKEDQADQLILLESIISENNELIFAEATPKYPSTKLYINHNPVSKKNYIQVQNLPGLAENQSYQLWSLKGDDAPIPLDVFDDDVNSIFEVAHVEGTNAYAITIEPKGGQQSPSLENLIGIFKLG